MPSVVLELPADLRDELKEPLGPIYTDTESLLSDAGTPLVAVGDIVTYHLLDAGYTPTVALVDERTKREAVDADVRDAVVGAGSTSAFDHRIEVDNPPATLTDALLTALVEGLAEAGTTLIHVDGEEDLAALPAVLAVPDGASVVYGQPGEGMVLVTADDATRQRVRSLVRAMDGDSDAVLDALAD